MQISFLSIRVTVQISLTSQLFLLDINEIKWKANESFCLQVYFSHEQKRSRNFTNVPIQKRNFKVKCLRFQLSWDLSKSMLLIISIWAQTFSQIWPNFNYIFIHYNLQNDLSRNTCNLNKTQLSYERAISEKLTFLQGGQWRRPKNVQSWVSSIDNVTKTAKLL